MAGLISGPVILANITASLLNNDHFITIWYIIVLFIVFFYVSYHTLCYQSKSEPGLSLWAKILHHIRDKKIYLILLLLVYVSMLFFHHYLHILILLSYFGLIDFFKNYVFSRGEENNNF